MSEPLELLLGGPTWPEIFEKPELIKGRHPARLVADGISAWGCCCLGKRPPAFGRVLLAIADEVGMSKSPTCDNLIAFAREKGWLPLEMF